MRRILLLVLLLYASAARAESITVAAAISMKDALAKVSAVYKAEGGDAVEFTFGSSGQLAAQIQNGAPIDLFVSAARKQVETLSKAGMVDKDGQKLVVRNRLVLIVPAGAGAAPKSFADLRAVSVKHVAVGEPKTVPAGQYAAEVLASLQLEQALANRLIYGNNVRQVLTYVERGEVDAGLVYSSDAAESGAKVKVVAVAPPDSHQPIVYPGIVVTASKKKAAAEKFLAFLLSEKAQKIFVEAGFTPASADESHATSQLTSRPAQ